MGREKDDLIKAEDDWDRIARQNGYVCITCGNVIPKSEYTSDSKECGWCRNQTQKDD